jgi:hypothetical protein
MGRADIPGRIVVQKTVRVVREDGVGGGSVREKRGIMDDTDGRDSMDAGHWSRGRHPAHARQRKHSRP